MSLDYYYLILLQVHNIKANTIQCQLSIRGLLPGTCVYTFRLTLLIQISHDFKPYNVFRIKAIQTSQSYSMAEFIPCSNNSSPKVPLH